MLLVLGVRVSADHLPHGRVYLGEEGVGLFGRIVYVGDAELVCQRKGFLIHARTTDDEHFLVGLALGQGCFKGREAFGTREFDVLARKHDVAAVREGTFRQRFEGLAAHDDGAACSEGLEALQVVG